jgi:DNA replication protein DnaC
VHYVVVSGGTGKSHLAQAIGHAAIQQGYRVVYRETHVLLEELADAVIDNTRKQYMERISTVPLLIIDDFGMRKLPQTAPRICWRSSCAATNGQARC